MIRTPLRAHRRLAVPGGLTLRLVVACATAVAVFAGGAATAEARARWDTRVLARVPAPGYPAHAYVDPSGRIWEGTYVNPNGDAAPSRVFEFGTDGAVLRSFAIPGQRLDHEHGVQVATSDAAGRLVLLDRTPSRALILDPADGTTAPYATFPDLRPCGTDPPPGACSPTLADAPPFADYAAWLPDGSLLVTDYAQAVIWRVPPHGGTPTVWLADPRLDGQSFGTAGVWLLPGARTILISQASGLGLRAGNPATGHLYKIPLTGSGAPGGLVPFWESGLADLPDGFAVARSGTVYIADVGASAQLAEVAPDGHEVARFPTAYGTGANGSPIPFDSPSGLAFRGTSVIVANQSALAGDTSHMALLDVEVGEEGAPEIIPAGAGPGTAPLPTPGPTRRSVTAAVTARRGRAVTVRLARALSSHPVGVRITAGGRTVATGTLRGRVLRITLRRGALPRRTTIRRIRGDQPATAMVLR